MTQEPLKVLLVGCGGHALLMCRVLRGLGPQPLARVVAVIDPDPRALERAQSDLGLDSSACYQHLQEVSGPHARFEVALVATPANQRDMVSKFLGCGIPVIVENPLALNLETADEICDAANNTFCWVNDQWPFLDQVLQMRHRYEAGEIGELVSVEVGGKGRQADVEVIRIGTHLFNVAYLFTGAMTDGVALRGRDSHDLQATFTTQSGRLLTAEFFEDIDQGYDVGRCFIQLNGERGRLRAMGGLLERLYRSPLPHPSVGDAATDLLGEWELLPQPVGIWPIREGMDQQAMNDPLMNPSWGLWEQSVPLIRAGSTQSFFSPQQAQPAVQALSIISRSLGRPLTLV